MKKKLLKQTLLGISLLTVMGVSILSGTTGMEEAHGAGMVAIDEANFPDAAFRNYVSDNFDSGGVEYYKNKKPMQLLKLLSMRWAFLI